MGFSLFLTLFICPSFLIRLSRMIKFASFQIHFDPFTGEDQIRKALRVRSPPSFHRRVLIMCLPSRLSSPFPSLGVPPGPPDPSFSRASDIDILVIDFYTPCLLFFSFKNILMETSFFIMYNNNHNTIETSFYCVCQPSILPKHVLVFLLFLHKMLHFVGFFFYTTKTSFCFVLKNENYFLSNWWEEKKNSERAKNTRH